MRGVKYTAKEKRKAVEMWIGGGDIFYVAKKFKCTTRSLYRWRKDFDGTTASLENKSSRPHTPHPNAHTREETEYITALLRDRPDISYAEALGILRTEYGYSRTYYGFYRFVVKNGLRPTQEVNHYTPQQYDTPEMIGVKMQMDVKYVPLFCNRGAAYGKQYYQYTMIDEASRERFIYPYEAHTAQSTVDFVRRAIAYFGYIPAIIQTDNGTEFTNARKRKDGQPSERHIVEKLLKELGIKHKLTKPRTPRHNGKVERSHRTDQECFYSRLTFTSFDELREQMRIWNIRYNNRPHSSLRNRDGKRVWLTPLEKRNELIEQIQAGGGELRLAPAA